MITSSARSRKRFHFPFGIRTSDIDVWELVRTESVANAKEIPLHASGAPEHSPDENNTVAEKHSHARKCQMMRVSAGRYGTSREVVRVVHARTAGSPVQTSPKLLPQVRTDDVLQRVPVVLEPSVRVSA